MSKYHSKKITVDGETFDSKKEAERWRELSMLEKAGEIHSLARQVKFELIPAIREDPVTGPRGGVKPGKLLERPVYYVADFTYCLDGQYIVEDAKGVRTEAYKLKRKLMLYVHNIRILET